MCLSAAEENVFKCLLRGNDDEKNKKCLEGQPSPGYKTRVELYLDSRALHLYLAHRLELHLDSRALHSIRLDLTSIWLIDHLRREHPSMVPPYNGGENEGFLI